MKSDTKIAVLIPAYNEEKTILTVINDFSSLNIDNLSIIVCDNNSNDNTYDIAKNSGKVVVLREKKQGKGNAVRTMFRETEADIYVLVDADDTYKAHDLNKLLHPIINDNADMVIGDRLSSSYFTENKRKFHNFGNTLMKRLINYFFKANISDVMTGYRAFSKRFVKTFPCLSKGFEIETELTIHAIDKNLNIENVVIDYQDRPIDSPSKLNTISDGIKVILTFIKYFALYKPIKFFSFFAIIFACISTIALIPILIEFKQTHLVPRFPTLFVCIFVYIVTIQCFFTGVTLELLNKNNRQEFEYKLLSFS